MNENIIKRNELLAQKVIQGLKSRNMTGYYAADKDEALKLALGLIPENSSVTMGGAMSAHEIGLVDRRLLQLQITGYYLLSVPNHTLLEA